MVVLPLALTLGNPPSFPGRSPLSPVTNKLSGVQAQQGSDAVAHTQLGTAWNLTLKMFICQKSSQKLPVTRLYCGSEGLVLELHERSCWESQLEGE